MTDVLAQAVLIVGAGTMGRQIAATFAKNGAADLHVYEPNESQRESARAWIDEFVGAEYAATVRLTGELEPAEAAIVIEAVPEKTDLKREVLTQLLGAMPDATILTNSSSMPVDRLFESDEEDPAFARLANLHFYVRPWERRVVELMTSGSTDTARLDQVQSYMEAAGFRVFRLRKPSFGLLYNRIWAAVKREALAIVDEGIASPNEIDEICRALDPQPARGPFERMDTVGLDTIQLIETSYASERGTTVSQTLNDLVAARQLGRKTGLGFYSYQHDAEEGK